MLVCSEVQAGKKLGSINDKLQDIEMIFKLRSAEIKTAFKKMKADAQQKAA